MKNFADRLIEKIKEKGSALVVGIDPNIDLFPQQVLKHFDIDLNSSKNLQNIPNAFLYFGKKVISTVCDLAAAVKIQVAYFEKYGWQGVKVYQNLCKFAHEKGLIVIGDVKRADIGSTSLAYASSHLAKTRKGVPDGFNWYEDAITVNPYFGFDGIKPFIDCAKSSGKGIFILVKTTNPSSAELQDLKSARIPVYEHLARYVNTWGNDLIGSSSYSSIGAVVGATFPNVLSKLRRTLKNNFLLMPGFGAQSGSWDSYTLSLNRDGLGTLPCLSRYITYAFSNPVFVKQSQKGGAVAKSGKTTSDDSWLVPIRLAAIHTLKMLTK